MGDPARAVLTNSMLKVVTEDNLAELAIETGAHLTKGLNALAEKHPAFIQNVRGKGTFIAFDSETVGHRDKMIARLKQHGII